MVSRKQLDLTKASQTRQAMLAGRSQLVADTAKEILRATNQQGVAQRIKATRVRRSPYQPRVLFDLDELKQLAELISESGRLRQPIEVRRVADDPEHDFELIDGERRLQAIERVLEWSELDAFIYDDIPEQQAASLVALANLGRIDLSDYELARLVRTLMDNAGIPTMRKAASLLGCDEKKIRLLLKFFDLPDAVSQKLLIEPRLITISYIDKALDLVSDGHEAILTDAMQVAVDKKLTPSALFALIAKRTPKYPKASSSVARTIRTASGRQICDLIEKKNSLTIKYAEGLNQVRIRKVVEQALSKLSEEELKNEADKQ